MAKKKMTLAASVHDAILEMIIHSGTESESMLLTEGELVEKFQVSKSPVREALGKLCHEGVVRSIPRCGYVVVRLGEKDGHDNQQVRTILELSAMEANFGAFTPEYLSRIEAQIRESRDTMRGETDIWQVWQCNMDFHCLLIGVTGNPYLIKHLAECIDLERRFYAQSHWNATRRFQVMFNPSAHEDIYQALADGDKARTMRLLRGDINAHEK